MNLVFTCKSEKGFSVFKTALDESKYYADGINYEFRSFYFGCNTQTEADKLEREIQKIADQNDVSGYFESED